MPVDFLTPEQERRYGRMIEEPTPEQLARYFWLDDRDHHLVAQHRGSHNQLGFAIQLGTVRFLGIFLTDPTDVPLSVVRYVASQLQIANTSILERYRRSESRWDHTAEIRKAYGYRDFSDQPHHFEFVRWLYHHAWLTAERPSVLFDLATARCVEKKVLLPGVTILARLIAQIRDRVATRLWRLLAQVPNSSERNRLEQLLTAKVSSRQTELDRLRRPPTNLTAKGMLEGLERLAVVRSYGGTTWDLSHIPVGRLHTLARFAAAARAQAISRMSSERQLATLVAFANVFTITAQDDLLDLFDRLMTELLAKSQQEGKRARLRTIRDLDAAARQLREACVILLNDQTPDAKLRATIFARVSAEVLTDSIQTIDALTRRPEENVYFTQLFSHYNGIRRFLPQMFRMIHFEANSSAKPVLDAWRFLRDYEGTKKIPWTQAPVTGMTTSWQKVVYDENDQIQQRAYTFWVLIRLHEALRHHDIFVTPSERYNDPRAQLLQGQAWEAVRPQVLRTLDRTIDAEREVRELGEKLNTAYQQTAERWPENTDVRMENIQGKSRVVLTALDKLEEPHSLQTLRSQIQSLLPRIDLPELLLEVNTWTGFADAFTHFSEGGSRVQDLTTSVCAVLIAEACNIGLEPVVQLGVPALTRDRLTWVEQNYFRAETLTQANNKLVEYQSGLQLATTWGTGEVASADGLRFVTPVRTIHAGPNPKYFGAGRGVTYYNFASDQFTGLNGIVIPGTIRDSLYLLDLLLGQQTVLQPQEIMTDTAGYSDIIFGLFGLLGYQFSPRLADIGESRFWRLDPAANYGPLNDLARHRLHPERIVQNWNDMLRVAGSLKLGTVTASRLIRTLQRDGRPTTLGKAIGEYGRIYKTIYLLNYLNDPGYRRRILTQLNRGESRHSLARAVCYGKRGELHQRYKEGQEDQLGALGFVVNAIVLWNTRYMSAALQNLRVQGQMMDLTDIKRLSPVGHDHINMVGRYSFTLPEEIAHGDLRPLNRGSADSF